MVPVGVLLIVLAVAFGAGFLGSSGESADIQFYGLKLQDLPARNLVILGIITGLIAALGAESVRWGTARWRRRRRLARRRERELQAAVGQTTHPESDGSDKPLEKTESPEGTTAEPESSVEPEAAKPVEPDTSAEPTKAETKADDAPESRASEDREPELRASEEKPKDGV